MVIFTNENVREDVGQPRLPDVSNHTGSVPVGHPGLLVSQALDVKGRVGQHGVHERKTEDCRDDVDDGHHHQVPVVGVPFLQVVLRTVDHGGADVLVHEEQDGEGEPQGCCKEDGADCEFTEIYELHAVLPVKVEEVLFDAREGE